MTTPISDIVRKLGAAGCTVEQIAVAVELAEQEMLARTRRQSEANAARQRRYRTKNHNETLRDVTQRNEQLPPPVHINSPLKKNSEPKKVLRSISPDWVPSEENIAFATAKGWSREYALSEGLRFRDYCLSSGKKYRDIDAAWRNWVTSPYQNGKENGSGTHSNRTFQAPRHPPTNDDAILAGVARYAVRRGLIKPPDEPEDGEVRRRFNVAGEPDAD